MLGPRDLPLLAVFVTVVQKGSFTAAARDLGLAKSVVSQHVRTLEERCGVRLLERTTRALRLTQVGEQVLAAATPAVESVREVQRAVEAHRGAPTGTLRVTAVIDIGTRLVAPAAAHLSRAHPDLRVEIVSDDGQRDLVSEGFDVALRLGPARDSSLVMKKLGTEQEIIVAAPDVASRFTSAVRPSQLAGAPWVEHSALAITSVQRFRDAHGATDEVHVDTRARANTGEAMRALVLGGAGLAAIPYSMVHAEVSEGRLERLCPSWYRRDLVLYAAMPSGRRAPARVRAFLEALRDALPTAGFRAA